MAGDDKNHGALSTLAKLLVTRIEAVIRSHVNGMEDCIKKTPLKDVIHREEDNDLKILPAEPGVYAFRDCCRDEFLYVGKSPEQGVRVRIGQHLAPRDQGGTLRQHWCNRHCCDRNCGDRQACSGCAFETYEGFLSRDCEVWTIAAPCLANEAKADRLERMLISVTQPKFQKPQDA